jgi:tetratricopeptide (TPR) repeat protein
MTSVFLSYDRNDADRARPLALALEKAGHAVWWDLHVRSGAQFSKVIEEALTAAEAVVVLWSARSVESAWVRDEAAAGRDSGRLIPVSIDDTDPPLGFRQFQTIDLSRWKGRGEPAQLKTLLADVEAMAQTAAPSRKATAPPTIAKPASNFSRIRGRSAMALAVILLVGIAFAGWRVFRPPQIPVVAVTSAQASASSEALARELIVKLGSLWSTRTDAVRLTAPAASGAERADLMFEVAASSNANEQSASLALLSGRGRALLWSKDFESMRGGRPALEQSMAYTAGQVLDCALQANAPSQERLNEQTLKLFLNGCALFGERYRSDPNSVVPIFTQVVAAAPKFEPAWSKLLLAEAQNTRGQRLFFDRWAPGNLPEHIEAARRLDPQMPELYLAQLALLPLGALDQRLKLLDKGIELNPDNPDLRVSRSEFLSSMGRNSDAIGDARRAVQINPLSSGFRSNLIQVLAYSGQLAAAEEDLRRAELLWPGSPTIEDARFRFTSRFGDPREALRMLQSPDFRQYYTTQEMESYLEARINPTDSNIQLAIAASQAPQLSKGRRDVQFIQLLADFGRIDEIYVTLMRLNPSDARLAAGVIFRPAFEKFRRDPRFMQVAAHAGLIGFWRTTGMWPDFCFEANLPYNCKKVAAKLAP